MKIIKCNKCNGTGKIEVFKHIQNGICFECGGCGKLEVNDDYVSLSEWKAKIEKTEKEYLEIHNKYLEFKNRSSWDRRWEYKWGYAEISQYNTYEERKEILSAFEQFEKERKDIIIKSMTDNSIDMFDEIEKLYNKYLTQGEDYDRK